MRPLILILAILSLALLLTTTEARAQCPGGECAVSASGPVVRVVTAPVRLVRAAPAPLRFVRERFANRGLFRGRLRSGLGRIGARIRRPFGGRFPL